jgi:hypothetical protein
VFWMISICIMLGRIWRSVMLNSVGLYDVPSLDGLFP